MPLPFLINAGATAIGIGKAIASNPLKALGWASRTVGKHPLLGSAIKGAWDARQTNTAYQRQMRDMQRAGLNPILAAKMGGAQSAQLEGLGQVSNTARQIDQTEKLTDAQVNKIDQEINNLIAQEGLNYAQSANVREVTEKVIQESYGLVYDNVYKQIVANHQQNNPGMTIAKYYGTTVAKIADTILKGKGKGKKK